MDSAIPPSSKTHKNRRKTPVYLYLLLQENSQKNIPLCVVLRDGWRPSITGSVG